MGGSEKFSYRIVRSRKPLLLVLLYKTATTLIPSLPERSLMDIRWIPTSLDP